MWRKKKHPLKKQNWGFMLDQRRWNRAVFKADSMAALDFGYCERGFFTAFFLLTEPKFQSLPTLSSNRYCILLVSLRKQISSARRSDNINARGPFFKGNFHLFWLNEDPQW